MSNRRGTHQGGGGGQRATLADVAARVGMSKSAVSLALNNRPGSRLSQEAVARIHWRGEHHRTDIGHRASRA